MRAPGLVLLGLALAALLAGGLLVATARSAETTAAYAGSIDGGCFFDESCDTVPGVVAARRLAQVGWTVGGCSLLLAGLAVSTGREHSVRWVAPALVGAVGVVGGVALRTALLGGFVPPPELGCADRGSCGGEVGWVAAAGPANVALLVGVLGCLLLASALLRQLRRR